MSLVAVLPLVVVCTALVPGAAAVSPQSGVIDLLTHAELRLDGALAAGLAGTAVADAGDVNGDGRTDVIVGSPTASSNGRTFSGSAHVVFGGFSGPSVDLGALGPGGFQIDGAHGILSPPRGDRAGTSVAGAGDVNGDGLADLLVGAPEADNNGRENSGSAYVVFGKASQSPVDLLTLGSAGFRIDGQAAGYSAGRSVSGLGDVNGDQLADVLVGSPTAGDSGSHAGSAYVVFGKTSTTTVDLAALGAGGYRIDGAAANDTAGWSVSGIGDVNADGRPDLLVGSEGFAGHRGAAYVVFGKDTTTPIDLGTLGAGGFRIEGEAALDSAGWDVSGAGDVNGDGRQDIVVGAPEADNNGRARSGSAYVVFGKESPTNVALATLGDGGFRIDGAAVEDIAGTSVAGVGDVNGDGRADVLVGAPFSDNNGRDGSGSAYVVFGKVSAAPVDLATLGTGGYRLDGVTLTDYLGESVSRVGDVTGDGLPDLLIGAPRENPRSRGDEGAVHVFNFGRPRLAYASLAGVAGTAILPQAPTQLERTGPASFQVAPPLPAGLSIDGAGRVTGTPGAVHSRTHTVTLEDLVGTVTAQLAITVVAPLPPPPPPDTTAPRLTLRFASPQRALRQKKIVVRARCNEACTLSAQGSITIRGISALIRLRSTSASRRTTAERTLSLTLTKAARKRLAGFLAKGKRAKAIVSIRARDAAGNSRRASRGIVVRR